MIPLKNEKDLANWEKIDDVIMGGKSSSKIQSGPGQTAVWTGNLNIDGGGFCGTRNKVVINTQFLNGLIDAFFRLTNYLLSNNWILLRSIQTKP